MTLKYCSTVGVFIKKDPDRFMCMPITCAGYLVISHSMKNIM